MYAPFWTVVVFALGFVFFFKSVWTFAYRKLTSSNTSYLEAHAGFLKLHMKEIFDPYVLVTFGQKVDFLISNAS